MKKLLLAATALALVGCVEDQMPPTQAAFIDQISGYASQYYEAETGKNDIQIDRVLDARKKFLCNTKPEVSNWVGEVNRVSTSLNRFEQRIYVVSSIGNFRITSDNVDLKVQPEMYETIAQLKSGDRIRFSGTLGHHDDGCVMELSFTQHGGMSAPEFNIKYSEIALVSP